MYIWNTSRVHTNNQKGEILSKTEVTKMFFWKKMLWFQISAFTARVVVTMKEGWGSCFLIKPEAQKIKELPHEQTKTQQM